MKSWIGASILAACIVASPLFAQVCPDPATVPNEICDAAIPLGLNPDALTLQGNTALAVSDYDIGHGNPCTGARSNGPDVVYTAQVAPTCVLTVTLSLCNPVQWYDQSLYIVADCLDLLAACQGSDSPCDANGNCPIEQASWSNDTSSTQTVFIVLDGKFPSSGGAWNLDIGTDCVVPVEPATWGAIKATYE